MAKRSSGSGETLLALCAGEKGLQRKTKIYWIDTEENICMFSYVMK